MPSTLVNTDLVAQLLLNGAGEFAVITRTGTLRNNDSAIISTAFTTSITNNGEIVSGTTDRVPAKAAIRIGNGLSDIVNNGILVSTDGYAVGVGGGGGARLYNHGSIVGLIQFDSSSFTSLIVNTGNIAGSVGAGQDAFLDLSNAGTISDPFLAIAGGGLADTISNAGRIFGIVSLNAGNDRYEGALGLVTERVFGGGGDDTLRGGVGVDRFEGSDGDDLLEGGDGDDRLYGGAGLDELRGGNGNDTLVADGDLSGDLLDGGAGFDILDLGADTAGFLLDLATPTENTGFADRDVLISIEGAIGGTGADTLLGNGSANDLAGSGGNDSLDGRGGNDTMRGGAGGDLYRVDSVGDLVVERANGGLDIVLATTSYRLAPGWAVEALYADIEIPAVATAAMNLWGSNTANDIVGTNGANRLFGRGGADTVNGLDGTDTLSGGAGNDSLIGGAGNDSLLGEAGPDTLNGGADSDRLAGGDGADELTGGAGNDLFRFEGAFGLAFADRITDFDPVRDTIQLAQGTFAALPLGALAAAALEVGTPAATTAATRITVSASVDLTFLTLRYDPDGNGPGAASAFGIILGTPALTAADFFVVA